MEEINFSVIYPNEAPTRKDKKTSIKDSPKPFFSSSFQ